MKCRRCKKAPSMKHTDVCGICEVIEAQGQPRQKLFGAQTNDMVPKHWNMGLGEMVDGYDDLKKKRQEAKNKGVVDAWV